MTYINPSEIPIIKQVTYNPDGTIQTTLENGLTIYTSISKNKSKTPTEEKKANLSEILKEAFKNLGEGENA